MDDRYWILNPVEHRLEWLYRMAGRDGETVEFMGGEATLIVPSAPPADVWVCDLCNGEILIAWGDEPFPVPVLGSYALCAECFYKAQQWPERDDEDEPIGDRLLGEWPPHMCSCPPCTGIAVLWYGQLMAAYREVA